MAGSARFHHHNYHYYYHYQRRSDSGRVRSDRVGDGGTVSATSIVVITTTTTITALTMILTILIYKQFTMWHCSRQGQPKAAANVGVETTGAGYITTAITAIIIIAMIGVNV